MNKIIKFLFLFLAVSTFVFSCTKSEDESKADLIDEQNLSLNRISDNTILPILQDDYLVFQDNDAFENYILSIDDSDIQANLVESENNFLSYYNNVVESDVNTDLFGDASFASVLNQDGIVGIGDYVFLLDPSSKTVGVFFNSVNRGVLTTYKQTLREDLPSFYGKYSFDEPVLERFGWGCDTGCVPSNNKKEKDRNYCETSDGTIFKVKLRVKYVRLGIWHYLKFKFRHRCRTGCSGVSHNTDFILYWDASWTPRCKSTSTSYNFTGEHHTGSVVNHTFYRGFKCLSAYALKAEAYVTSACDPSVQFTVGPLLIRDAY